MLVAISAFGVPCALPQWGRAVRKATVVSETGAGVRGLVSSSRFARRQRSKQ